MAPDEILKQAQNAAKIASEKLATKNTKVKILKYYYFSYFSNQKIKYSIVNNIVVY